MTSCSGCLLCLVPPALTIHKLFISSGILFQLNTEPHPAPGSKVTYTIQLLFTLPNDVWDHVCVCVRLFIGSQDQWSQQVFLTRKIHGQTKKVWVLSSQLKYCTLSMRGRQKWISGGMSNSPCPTCTLGHFHNPGTTVSCL